MQSLSMCAKPARSWLVQKSQAARDLILAGERLLRGGNFSEANRLWS
jgi:hypothetical protein